MSFSDKGKKVFQKLSMHGIRRKFTAAADIKAGDEVYISAANTVSPRGGSPAERPIGVAVEAAANTTKVLVETYFKAIEDNNSAAAIAAGAVVFQDGNHDSEDRPQVITATGGGNFATGIALGSAAGADETIQVGYLPFPITL